MITVLDDPFGAIRNRDVVFATRPMGILWLATGLVVQGREVITTLVDDLIVVENDRSIWKVNLANPPDVVAPFGNLGLMPDIGEPSGITVDANGDALVVNTQHRFMRVNLASPSDTTGDYGVLLNLGGPFANNEDARGIGIDGNGDVIVVTNQDRLFRFSAADPSLNTGIYGLIGQLLSVNQARAVAIDANGDAIVLVSGGHLSRWDLSDLTNRSGRYASLGQIAVLQAGADGWQGLAILANGHAIAIGDNGVVYEITFGGTNDTIQSVERLGTSRVRFAQPTRPEHHRPRGNQLRRVDRYRHAARVHVSRWESIRWRHRYGRGRRRLHGGCRWWMAGCRGQHPGQLSADSIAAESEQRRQRGAAGYGATEHRQRVIK